MVQDGEGDNEWMTKYHERHRLRAMQRRERYSDEDLIRWLDTQVGDISIGGGKTEDRHTYQTWTYPYPINKAVRRRTRIDWRDVDPTIGGGK
jgi:hypothetical protein